MADDDELWTPVSLAGEVMLANNPAAAALYDVYLTPKKAKTLLSEGQLPHFESAWATSYHDDATHEIMLRAAITPKTWAGYTPPFDTEGVARLKFAFQEYERHGTDAGWVRSIERPFRGAHLNDKSLEYAVYVALAAQAYTTTGINELRNAFPHVHTDVMDNVEGIPAVVCAALLGDIKETNKLGGILCGIRGPNVLRDVNTGLRAIEKAPTFDHIQPFGDVYFNKVMMDFITVPDAADVALAEGGAAAYNTTNTEKLKRVGKVLYLSRYISPPCNGVAHLLSAVAAAIRSEIRTFAMAVVIGAWRRAGFYPGKTRIATLPRLPNDMVLVIRDLHLSMRV